MNRLRTYRRILGYLWPYRGRFTIAVISTIFVGGTIGIPVFLIRYILDDVLIAKDADKLFQYSLLLVAISGLNGILFYLQNYCTYWVGQRVVMDIRNALHRHLVLLPLSFFDNKTTGELMAKVTYDITLMQKAASSAIRDLGRHASTIVWLLGVALYQSPKMALICFVVIPPIGVLVGFLGEKIRRITRTTQEKMGDMNALMKEIYSGMRVVKAFRAESVEAARFERANLSFFRRTMKAMRIRAMTPPIVTIIGGILFGFALMYGGNMVIREEITIGELSSFIIAIGAIFGPLKSLSRVYHTLMEGVAGGQSVFELMDANVPEETNRSGKKLAGLSKGIKFSDVSFSYGSEQVLKNLSMDVPAGSVFALVGLSGAGKTTLLDLIPRFYIPSSGRIEFDGIEGKEFDLRSLRSQIGVVGQQVILFDDTVANNIAYGANGNFAQDNVVVAAKAANAHDFIMGLPQGYDTILGEDGVRLSGGERQRISIARAILQDPPILLLDEATSSLDTESEKIIQEALDRLMKGRTTMVVAHRLSTIRNASVIGVLEKGRLVEMGTHDELMEHSGIYRRLCEMQFATSDEPINGVSEDIQEEERTSAVERERTT